MSSLAPAVVLDNAEDDNAEANRGFVIVLEARCQTAQQDARVGPQPLKVRRVRGIPHHQQDAWNLEAHTSSLHLSNATFGPLRMVCAL